MGLEADDYKEAGLTVAVFVCGLWLVDYLFWYWAIGAVLYTGYTLFRSQLHLRDLTDEAVCIVGVSGRLGESLALEFLRKGCRVALWDPDIDALHQAENKLLQALPHATVKGYLVDPTSRGMVYDAADQVLHDFGPIGVLLHNTTTASGLAFSDCIDDHLLGALELNTASKYWTCRAFLPSMADRNAGSIVLLATQGAIQGCSGLVDYTASQFAALGFAESLRLEMKALRRSIVVSTVVLYVASAGAGQAGLSTSPESTVAAQRIVRGVETGVQHQVLSWKCTLLVLTRILPVNIRETLLWVFNADSVPFSSRARFL